MNNRERNIQKACLLYKRPLEAEFNYAVYCALKGIKHALKKLKKLKEIKYERTKV